MRAWLVTLSLLLLLTGPTRAGVLPLVDPGDAAAEKRLEPNAEEVSVARSPAGVTVTIQPGAAGYPGVTLKPQGGSVWDLSGNGHVAARIVNTGKTKIGVCLDVHNEGPWQEHRSNASTIWLEPGASGTVKTIFGYSWNKPAYPLKPAEVSKIVLYVPKSDKPQEFRIESIEAAGEPGEKPPVDPASIRSRPKAGVIVGEGIPLDLVRLATSGLEAGQVTRAATGAIAIALPASDKEASLTVKPPEGVWNLNDTLRMCVTLTNTSSAPLTPSIRLDSRAGSGAPVSQEIAPGQTVTIEVAYFAPAVMTGEGGKTTKGTRFASDVTTGVTILVGARTAEASVRIDRIAADVPPAPALPQWLGKRPPVEGAWKQTLDENFDGAALDTSIWNTYFPYETPKGVFQASRDNAIVAGGVLRLRYEKRKAHMFDDPTRPAAGYATGYVDSYGKWRQRYGYFEARVRLSTAPGMFPAFWLMPDRGGDGPQWKRQSTSDGGMEFDVFENLSRWGPYRQSIAHHWDGYLKDHKSNGAMNLYVQPDQDGFMTCGLLWLPGQAIYYYNGVEICRWEHPRIGEHPSILLLNQHSGGWDNDPVDDATLPSDYVVDYVRVWQRDDLASDADGKMKR